MTPSVFAVCYVPHIFDTIASFRLSNRLKLNAEKTQLIWIGTGQQLAKLTVTQLQLINLVVECDSTARNLGVVLDGQLSMSQQVTAVCRPCSTSFVS